MVEVVVPLARGVEHVGFKGKRDEDHPFQTFATDFERMVTEVFFSPFFGSMLRVTLFDGNDVMYSVFFPLPPLKVPVICLSCVVVPTLQPIALS